MKIATLPLTLLGLTAYSLSSITVADWDTGACPGGGSAPCIETEINGNTYHFNGTGGTRMHGMVALPRRAVVTSSSKATIYPWRVPSILTAPWRSAARLRSARIQPVHGASVCRSTRPRCQTALSAAQSLSVASWYSKDPTISGHCPFEDDCDSFIPYDPNATSYTGNFGSIDVTALGIALVNGEHIHGVVFTPGIGANIAFASDLYDCDENANCSMDGALTINNATSFYIR